MGGCGYIFYTLLHTLNRKSSIKPLPSFYGGFEQLEEGAGGEGKQLEGGAKKGYFYLNNERKIREEVVFFIDNLPQTGKMSLHWSDENLFLTFPAKPMAFKVSCGWCNK